MMEISNTTLDFYRNCLIQCDYPDILKMDYKHIQKILNKENRINFLHWALVKVNPSYESQLQRFKYLKKLELGLADILYANGCCLDSQKQDFVLGKLKIEEEVPCFNRLFKLLTAVDSNVDRENITPQISSIICSLQKLDTGFEKKVFAEEQLFDSKIKRLNEKEKSEKLIKCEKEKINLDEAILDTEKQIDTLQNELNNAKCSTLFNSDELEEVCTKVSTLISDFIKDFPQYSAHFLKLADKTIDENLGLKVRNCSINLNYIKKVLNNKNYVNNLNLPGEDSDSSATSELLANNFFLSEKLFFEE